ncbi:hypothetical protein [Mesorhizobium sp. B2-4-1]|uniref:hypothetical protein n=1 Tax=Mesorhizobium sp. B2-4-1 TaxID=2589948 RepID=UPI0011286117|nr:hypothetical protein [Mesorhizobium sp. B2-4-1]TPL66642.1 hypothetical protein FJ949_09765 [Mesorhizobium sp. B2-4-1]
MNKVVEIFTTITALIAMIVVPPLAGVIAYGLWLTFPSPFDMQNPALAAGAWTGIVVAALIKRGFE